MDKYISGTEPISVNNSLAEFTLNYYLEPSSGTENLKIIGTDITNFNLPSGYRHADVIAINGDTYEFKRKTIDLGQPEFSVAYEPVGETEHNVIFNSLDDKITFEDAVPMLFVQIRFYN